MRRKLLLVLGISLCIILLIGILYFLLGWDKYIVFSWDSADEDEYAYRKCMQREGDILSCAIGRVTFCRFKGIWIKSWNFGYVISSKCSGI